MKKQNYRVFALVQAVVMLLFMAGPSMLHAMADAATTITDVGGPSLNEQYGLTRIYLNTDAAYGSELAGNYKHIENADHVSSPVDAAVQASWLTAFKINEKTLAEYNATTWNAVSIYLNNVGGKQQYEVRVTNAACSTIRPSVNLTLQVEETLLDINGNPIAPMTMYWIVSENAWTALSDKQKEIAAKIDTLLPVEDLTLDDIDRYDAILAEFMKLTDAEKKVIPNADVLHKAEAIMTYLKGLPKVTFDEDHVVMNFVAFSDVHITTGPDMMDTAESGCTAERYEHAMEQIGKMNLDALIFLGDMCNDTAYTDDQSILDEELGTFKNLTEKYVDDDVDLFYCLGNHDSQNSHDENYMPDGKVARYYKERLGDRWLVKDEYNDGMGNRHAVINGYHFLAVEPKWKGGGSYTDETIAWFQDTLESIVNAPDYHDEYIFVLSHPIASGDDIYGAGGAISTFPRLHEVMEQYPQIVKLSGHTHFPMNNETSINQSEYTSVGIGSMFYITMYYWEDLLMDGGTYNVKGYYPADSRETAPGLQVQIDADGNMKMTRIDFYRDGELIKDSWLIPAVDTENKSHLNYYGVARANINTAPYFEEGDRLTVERETANRLSLTWNTAEDDDEVYYYRVDILQNGEVVDSRRVYSHFWRYDQPADWPAYQTVKMDNPALTAPYEIRLYAVDVWMKESENYLTAAVAAPTPSELAHAQTVERLISQIGEVTASSEDAIEAAEAAFLALTRDERYAVGNIDCLRTARLTYNQLTASQAALPDIFEYVTVTSVQNVMPAINNDLLFAVFLFDVDPGETLNMHAGYMAGPGGEPRPAYLHVNCLDHVRINGKSLRAWQAEGKDFQVHFSAVNGAALLHIYWDPDVMTACTMDQTFTIGVDEGFITTNNQIVRPFTATWDTANLKVVFDKAEGAAQERPTAVRVTDDSVELKAVGGCEYRMNKGDWRKEPLFTKLQTGRSYTFYIRTAETDQNHAGAISPALTVTVLAKSVKDISLAKPPAKTAYLRGETLDLTGGELQITYADNTVDTIPITAAMISGYDDYKLGEQVVSVTYEGVTVSFTVSVTAGSAVEPDNSDPGKDPGPDKKPDGQSNASHPDPGKDSVDKNPGTGGGNPAWPIAGIAVSSALVPFLVRRRTTAARTQ